MKKCLTLLFLAIFTFSCSWQKVEENKNLSEIWKKCENIKVWMTFDELKKQEWEPTEFEVNEYYYWNMGSEVCDIKVSDWKVISKKYSSVNL